MVDILFSTEEIERLILEDIPYFDLTTTLLGIGDREGEIIYTSRHPIVVCCTEEASRIFSSLGLEVTSFVPSGTYVGKDTVILSGKGKACGLHKAWRACLILMEYASGMATRTRRLVELAREVNPDISVVTTRKHFPFGKKVSIKAILAGGALPHRLGLSETILIFGEHVAFLGGYDGLIREMPKIRKRAPEKKIVVEVKDVATAKRVVEAGIDVVQLDKFSPREVEEVVRFSRPFSVAVAAAGGIGEANIKDYAATGADIIVTSFSYFGKPADIRVDLRPSGGD